MGLDTLKPPRRRLFCNVVSDINISCCVISGRYCYISASESSAIRFNVSGALAALISAAACRVVAFVVRVAFKLFNRHHSSSLPFGAVCVVLTLTLYLVCLELSRGFTNKFVCLDKFVVLNKLYSVALVSLYKVYRK